MESEPSVLGPQLMEAEWGVFTIVTLHYNTPPQTLPHGFNKSRFHQQAVIKDKKSVTQCLNASCSGKEKKFTAHSEKICSSDSRKDI